MKKILSFALAAVMMLSAVIITPAFDYSDVLDAHNVGATAQYFGGQLDYTELYGTFADGIEPGDPMTIKNGDASKGVLNLDGIIEDGEWTDVVYHISSKYAPENMGDSYTLNPLFEAPSAENSFYYFVYSAANANGNRTRLDPKDGLSYDIRFMWDEDYLYLAVETVDVDGILNIGNSAVGNNWDGDAFQFRVDPNGPNAIAGGKGYDAAVDSFPYDKEIHGDTDNTLNCTYPWSDDFTEYTGYGQETRSTLGNFIISHHTGGGYTDICDASLRYFPEAGEPIENEDGTVTETTIWHCADASSYGDLEESKYIWASCLPTQIAGTWEKPITNTVYEIAVPWDIIEIQGQDYAPEANDILGISTVLFNYATGGRGFNSYLEWGSGLCGYYTHNRPELCGGSNALVLEGTPYSDAVGCDHEFADATCFDPEICMNCGYERGFSIGHKYEFYNEILPGGMILPGDTGNEGSISCKCVLCGDTFTQSIPVTDAEVKYNFLTTDSKINDQGLNTGFTSQWEEIDPVTGKYYEEGDPRKQVLWNIDGSAKCSYDTAAFGYAVADLDVSQTGTYFDANTLPYASFTEKTDVYFTSFDRKSPSAVDYNTFFGQQFGGKNRVSYLAGLVEVEDEYYFAIYPSHLTKKVTFDELSSNALCIRKATSEQIATDVWHEYVFFYDNDSSTAMLFWDDELVASAWDDDLRSDSEAAYPILRRFHIDMYLKDIEIGSSGLAVNHLNYEPVIKTTLILNGEERYCTAGETVRISTKSEYKENGITYRFYRWIGDTDALTDTSAASTSFIMPQRDIYLDAEYVAVGDIYQDGKINGKDSFYLKSIITGKIDQCPEADIDGNGSVNAYDANLLLRAIIETGY